MNTGVTLDNVHKRLLDNLKTGVLLLDAELRLLYLNMEAEHLLEISDTKAKQAFIGDVLIGAESDIAEISNAMNSHSSFTKRAVELTVRPGKSILVDYTLSPVSENGNIQAVLELTSLEHSHRMSQEESLHTAHMTTRELVRGLAHEIKNPLGGIRGAAQLLAQEIDSEELQDYTNVIIEEADRLHKLVDRLVGSRKPLEIASINIHEVLERVRNLVKADAASENITIDIDYDPSIPNMEADSDRLIQATLNIVRNAMQWLDKHADKANGRIILRTRISRNATIGTRFHRLAVKVEVEDNGPGIPAHMLGTIFYPMISGRADGSGLGLPITHGIINQHHGLIECSSKPGQTVFSVLLPFDYVENDEATTPLASGK